jgi:hypothetical protein
VNTKFTVGTNCPVRFYSADPEEQTEENTKDDGAKGDFEWGTPLPF